MNDDDFRKEITIRDILEGIFVEIPRQIATNLPGAIAEGFRDILARWTGGI